jgi:hypothetical protein
MPGHGRVRKYYRCKERDAAQYILLKSILDKYTTMDKLLEVDHGYSTQMNESMNINIAWLAQKNKTLSGSKSLSMRVHLAVGITLIGYEPYVKELLTHMGIQVTEGTARHLGKLWKKKKKMSDKHKDKAFKRKGHEKKRKKMDEEIKLAEKKRRKDGFYKPGEGFNLCLPIVEPKARELCRAGCGRWDHKTSKSRKCLFNVNNQREAAAALASLDDVCPTTIVEGNLKDDRNYK